MLILLAFSRNKWIKITLQKFVLILEDISTFYGDTNTQVLDFWWCLLWVSKPQLEALFLPGVGRHVTPFLIFISGATPLDGQHDSLVILLKQASNQWCGTKLWSIMLQTNALLTQLNWLSYTGSAHQKFNQQHFPKVPITIKQEIGL